MEKNTPFSKKIKINYYYYYLKSNILVYIYIIMYVKNNKKYVNFFLNDIFLECIFFKKKLVF